MGRRIVMYTICFEEHGPSTTQPLSLRIYGMLLKVSIYLFRKPACSTEIANGWCAPESSTLAMLPLKCPDVSRWADLPKVRMATMARLVEWKDVHSCPHEYFEMVEALTLPNAKKTASRYHAFPQGEA
eukprot:576558-Amphidinium_carterae.3